MSFSYRITSFYDIGFNNFYKSIASEVQLLTFDIYTDSEITKKINDVIDLKLVNFNAKIDRNLNNGTIIFNTEQDFQRFILTWT